MSFDGRLKGYIIEIRFPRVGYEFLENCWSPHYVIECAEGSTLCVFLSHGF